jgi:hypothetical protein
MGRCEQETDMSLNDGTVTIDHAAYVTLERQARAHGALLDALREAQWHLSGGSEGRTRMRTDELLPLIRTALMLAEGAERCGHSACSQNFIDTGDTSCIEGEE